MRYKTIAITLGLLTIMAVGLSLETSSEAVLMTEATQIHTFASV